MERTPQEMLLQLTQNPLKNLAFLKEVFQLGVSISSQGRYNHFDTAAGAPLLYRIFSKKARIINLAIFIFFVF